MRHSPEVVADMLMLNAADFYREEVAERVNQEHGTNVSARDVGEVINQVEAEVKESGDYRGVVMSHIGRGLGANIGKESGVEVAALFSEF